MRVPEVVGKYETKLDIMAHSSTISYSSHAERDNKIDVVRLRKETKTFTMILHLLCTAGVQVKKQVKSCLMSCDW